MLAELHDMFLEGLQANPQNLAIIAGALLVAAVALLGAVQ